MCVYVRLCMYVCVCVCVCKMTHQSKRIIISYACFFLVLIDCDNERLATVAGRQSLAVGCTCSCVAASIEHCLCEKDLQDRLY